MVGRAEEGSRKKLGKKKSDGLKNFRRVRRRRRDDVPKPLCLFMHLNPTPKLNRPPPTNHRPGVGPSRPRTIMPSSKRQTDGAAAGVAAASSSATAAATATATAAAAAAAAASGAAAAGPPAAARDAAAQQPNPNPPPAEKKRKRAWHREQRLKQQQEAPDVMEGVDGDGDGDAALVEAGGDLSLGPGRGFLTPAEAARAVQAFREEEVTALRASAPVDCGSSSLLLFGLLRPASGRWCVFWIL